jgi:hypothetical protein
MIIKKDKQTHEKKRDKMYQLTFGEGKISGGQRTNVEIYGRRPDEQKWIPDEK